MYLKLNNIKNVSPSVALATLQVRNSYKWLVATTVKVDTEHPYHRRQFYWTILFRTSLSSNSARWIPTPICCVGPPSPDAITHRVLQLAPRDHPDAPPPKDQTAQIS